MGQLSPILRKLLPKVSTVHHPAIRRRGAGHFVKMVHNGIEYAEMQIIAEAHDIMSSIPWRAVGKRKQRAAAGV